MRTTTESIRSRARGRCILLGAVLALAGCAASPPKSAPPLAAASARDRSGTALQGRPALPDLRQMVLPGVSGLLRGGRRGIVVRRVLPRPADRQWRDLRHARADRGASDAAAAERGAGDQPRQRPQPRAAGQRPRAVRQEPADRPVAGRGARARLRGSRVWPRCTSSIWASPSSTRSRSGRARRASTPRSPAIWPRPGGWCASPAPPGAARAGAGCARVARATARRR